MKNNLSKVSKSVIALGAIAMVGGGLGVAAMANADTLAPTTTTSSISAQAARGAHAPGVMGKVTAVNGTTLTVSSTNRKTSAVTVYTVDATNAKVMKFTAPTTQGAARVAPATITVSGISVGDTVMVSGTISGTNVTATNIMDGMMMGGHGMGGRGGQQGPHGATGKITAVNGSTVTITDSKGNTYTIDASSSKLEKISTISVSDLAVGDTISVQGTVSGTSVAAKNIIDGVMTGGFGGGQHAPNAPATSSAQN